MRFHAGVALLSSLLASIKPASSFASVSLALTRTTTKMNQSTSSSASESGALVNGVEDICDGFDTFLLDMWGVMHDGSRPYEGVLDVVKKLKEHNKKLIILSNSSKRKGNSIQMLNRLGFDPNDFDQIITSGEVAYQMLSGQLNSWSVLEDLLTEESRKKVFVLGSGDDDEAYCESCGWTLASIEEANLIIARGTFTVNDGSLVANKRENEQEYEAALESSLQQAALRRVPMLVTNPDKVRPDAERPPMPGKIGDRYEQILSESGVDGGELVKRIGKPFSDVYDLALGDSPDRSRVCMVGDALETDITGATLCALTSIWILMDGIYSPDLEGAEDLEATASDIVQHFNEESGTYAADQRVFPDISMRHFKW